MIGVSAQTYKHILSAFVETRRSSSPPKNLIDSNLLSSLTVFIKNLMVDVRDLSKSIVKYNHQIDRRLCRMEVAVNKILVRIGDITRSDATQSNGVSRAVPQNVEFNSGDRPSPNQENHFYSSNGPRREVHGDVSRSSHHNPRTQRSPELPMLSLNELSDLNQQLKNADYFTFLVHLLAFRSFKWCCFLNENRYFVAGESRKGLLYTRGKFNKNCHRDGLFKKIYFVASKTPTNTEGIKKRPWIDTV